MSISNVKQEMLEHLKEILQMEGSAGGMYTELAAAVDNSQLKSFFQDLAKEEQEHARLVSDLIMLLDSSQQSQKPWHEPYTG
ncbi:MAG: DUF892 family protein [Candidatus Aenigmatarchaeota archaeon]